MVMVIVWWRWWGCGCCLGGHRRGSRGRCRGCGGGSCGCSLGMFASFPCPLAMLDQAEKLHSAFPFSVWALGPTTFIASFTAQVVLPADSNASPQAFHNSTVHSRGDCAPSKEPHPRSPPQTSCGGLRGRCVPHLVGYNDFCLWDGEVQEAGLMIAGKAGFSDQGHMNKGLQRAGRRWRRCGGGEKD